MTIDLEQLRSGPMCLTQEIGGYLLQACLVCLDKFKHCSPTDYDLTGTTTATLALEWTTPVDEKTRRNWADLQEATEYAATGIAILLAEHLSGFDCIERSSKGTGFDYWLGTEDPLGVFNGKAKLEISGILEESPTNNLSKRVKEKQSQTTKSSHLGIEANISVSEFSTPKGDYSIIP